MSISRADSLPVYNRAVCALIILTSGNVLNSVCEIVVNQLYLLRVLGKRRGKINQRSNRFFKVLLRLFEIICGTVEINRKRRDNSASVHIIVKRAVNPEKFGVVVINAVNYVRDIRGLYGNAHIYCLHTVMERCVNLVVCLLVCTGEQISVKIEVIGERVSVHINTTDLPNGSSAACDLPVGVGVLLCGYGNFLQARSV